MFFKRSLVVESCGVGTDETCENFNTPIPGATRPLLSMVLLKYFAEAPNDNGVCIVQLPIYIHLLTTTCRHNKAAVVTKNACKSICLGVQLRHRLIDNYADYTGS